MLHLPWEYWPTLLTKFGNASTLPLQQAVQQVVERAFGKTREDVGRSVALAAQGETPRISSVSPSELFRRHPEQFRALNAAYEQAQAAKQERAKVREDAEQDRARAEQDEEQARMLLAAAAERRERAATREAIAVAADEEAERNLAVIGGQIDALWLGVEKANYGIFYIRVYGVEPERGMMTIPQVEVGESSSIRKNDGNAPPFRWDMKRPCDDAYAIQEFVRKHVFGWYRVPKRRDHMFDLDGRLFWRLVDYLSKESFLTLDYVQRFIPIEN
jgi:hypothetical protein